MKLATLLGPDLTAAGSTDRAITGITADSRKAMPGCVFAALAGTKADGARFVADAVANGAVAILCDTHTAITVPDGVVVLRAAEPRLALAQMAARFYSRQPQSIVAVTGTAGKTSVAEFTRQLMQACGHQSASLGTLGLISPAGADYGSLTTPDPVSLHRTLDTLARDGVTHLAMEASSHGLDQYRLDGVRLMAGAFTNLGRDHLDYHPTMAAYLDAKLGLFERLLQPGQTAVIAADGAEAATVIARCRTRGLRVITTGQKGHDLRLAVVVREGFGQRLEIEADGRRHALALNLIGDYQASNALVAAGLAIAAGIQTADAIQAIRTLTGVPGRLEVVGNARGGTVVVDYAHKPDALMAALAALRPFATGKLIVIVGCGGDRDRGKRPIMGRIAAELADIAIITDDNPRTETPAEIRAEVMAGAPGRLREIGDRAEAISAGVSMLSEGDVLVVAGKGHENGQIVGQTTLPFLDADVVRTALTEIGPR